MQCGLLGEKLGHSYSPQIHGQLADYSYALYEKQPQELEQFLKNGAFTGLNVTIPYKKAVISHLTELSPIAQRLEAVNTIVKRPDSTLIGHNSDYFGFRSMVEKSGLTVSGKKVLVLGSGGASNTAVAVLEELGANVVVISRNGENNYDNLHLHNDASVIVNATPVGMYPKVGTSPVCLGQFPSLEGVLDIVYNPARTQLLLDAEKRGLVTMNGLWMLVAQAKESAEWFTGTKIPDEKIDQIYRKLRLQMENIILIGMPGSGKSTIGQHLAKTLGKELVDADAETVKLCGMPIPDIFAKGGETCFRQAETQVLSQLGKRSGLIIATGGGCVTREENYPLLHQNGRILWLTRSLQKLPTDGRPLSQSGKLEQMFKIRKPMYERFADHVISNDASPEATVQTIIEALEGTK